jgi:hypothetical protein
MNKTARKVAALAITAALALGIVAATEQSASAIRFKAHSVTAIRF